jgi:hypothetical protein
MISILCIFVLFIFVIRLKIYYYFFVEQCNEYEFFCLVTYIEKDVFMEIENEKILQYFQKMSERREQL